MYSGTTSCQSCPANCFNCLSTGVCADCSYNIPRFNGLSNRFDTSFAAGATGGAGALYCDSSGKYILQGKVTNNLFLLVSRSSTTLYLTYYLTPDTVSCGRTCTGDFSEPFGDINDILYNVIVFFFGRGELSFFESIYSWFRTLVRIFTITRKYS